MKKVGIVGGSLLLVIIFSLIVSLINTNNNLVNQEETIIAQYNQNKNNYDNYFKKLKEACQVPDMYRDDFQQVYDKIMTRRYGKEGSKALFQWIQENNPNFDSSLYKQIQQIVEAGRNNFEVNQKILLDKKRVYQTKLRSFPTNILSRILGFPKIKLDDFNIVTSDLTEDIFKTKKSEVINLR